MGKVEDILNKYRAKLERNAEVAFGESNERVGESFTREYLQFKEESLRNLTFYEKSAKVSGAILKVKPPAKDQQKFNEALQRLGMDLSPSEAVSLAVNLFVLSLLISISAFVVYFIFTGTFTFLYLFLGIAFSGFIFYYLYTFPFVQAKKWHLKVSSQLVQALLYIVVYMKHTPNLERAIKFASENLQPPLSLDFKKIFWDVETGKYASVRESIDAYLESWRESSLEFVESMHLIESSLYEPVEYNRIVALEKSVTVMLEGVEEKMLNYTHNIKAPLTNIYMLGIVLPTLALALIPLASALLGGLLTWQHIFILFNVIIPFFVYYMTSQVLLTRPGGYGETELLEMHPDYKLYRSKKGAVAGFFAALPFFVLSIVPLLLLFPVISTSVGLEDFELPFLGKFFDFKELDGKLIGPFGIGAMLLSLLFPLSISLFYVIKYNSQTSKLIKTRRETKKLEQEYSSALFQLGNRLAAGVPAEMAFGRVAQVLGNTPPGQFFALVNNNIQNGMSVREAIFNRQRGAITFFPSSLIKTSMFILIESVRKGLKIAAESMMSIAEHAKNIHRIEERLKDLVADVVVSMKSNVAFLAPVLAGIIVGLAAMITLIINQLSSLLLSPGIEGAEGVGLGGAAGIVTLFEVEKMIPPYFLQLSIGLYLIQIIFILTATVVVIENGSDKLTEKNEIAKGLYRGMTLYLIVALLSILILSLLASLVMSQVAIG